MQIINLPIPDIKLLEPKVFSDPRGFFFESWNERNFAEIGLREKFVQDNHSRSAKNVLRGLHYQIQQAQGKLLRVIEGEIFDVVVDIRRSSPTFGKSVTAILSAENKRMIWVPIGFAHGFVVLSDNAQVLYKTTDYYAPEYERCIIWNDPLLGIRWPILGEPLLSDKDRTGVLLQNAETFP